METILETPRGARAILVLAHGAGAGMRHPAMEALAAALGREKIATLRFLFPYMERGSRRPDSPAIAIEQIVRAVEEAKRRAPRLSRFAGGKSFGGRMTTHAAAAGKLEGVKGIICFAFPLHPAKKPGTKRAEHLSDVALPTLFIQGTRDDLADPKRMKAVLAKLPRTFKTHTLEGADHGFAVRKSSGRTGEDVLEEAAAAARTFIERLRSKR